jgi:hypothetical protein
MYIWFEEYGIGYISIKYIWLKEYARQRDEWKQTDVGAQMSLDRCQWTNVGGWTSVNGEVEWTKPDE